MDKDDSTLPINTSHILPSVTTKPKRTKTTHACDLCKKKKVKCNGDHPCNRCQKLTVPCTFTPNQSKWDSSAPYATTQAQRLYALEKALDSLQVDLPTRSLDTNSHASPGINDAAPPTITSPLEKFNTSSTGKPYYAEDWNTRLDRLSPTFYKTINLPENGPRISDGLAQSEMTIIHFDLISIFFGQVHPYFPVIHQDSFCLDLNNASPLLLNIMYAMASRWSDMNSMLFGSGPTSTQEQQQSSSQERNPSSFSLKYYHDAIALVELYMDVPRLTTIQALLLIIRYQEVVRRPGFFSRTRFYLGLAIRMCNDLGLPHKLPATCQIHPNLAEERRRVFWMVYIYDLLISTELGIAVNFSIDRCSVELPGLLEDEKNNKEQHDTILYLHWMTRVMKSQGLVLQYLRRKYEEGSYQQQQNMCEHLQSIDQHMKELGMELNTLREYADDRVDFVFLAYHFTNILLHRSLCLDLLDITGDDGIVNNVSHGVSNQDSVMILLLQEATAITNIVDTLLLDHTATSLYHGFRGTQQIIHYLTAVRTVQLMYRQENDIHVKRLLHHLTTLTPAVELHSIERASRFGAEVELMEIQNQHSIKRASEQTVNQQGPVARPPPLSSPLSISSPPTTSPSFNGPSSSSSSSLSPLVTTAYHQNTAEYLPQSSAIYTDDDIIDSMVNTLPNTNALELSSDTFWQHQQQMDQNWPQESVENISRQQQGPNLAASYKHNVSLTLDTSALPLLYQPSSSSDISPMIPTPLPLIVSDPTALASTIPAPTHQSIGVRRSHQHLRKAPPQWLSSSSTVAAASHDHLSPTYPRPNNKNLSTQQPSAPPPQRLYGITSRQPSPSTSSLPSSPLHRMTLSDDTTWTQPTSSLVLPSYPQQQQQ
ncbi:fungal-specific transcription factor domain-domain-containing protein [Absidia repens]|uniref:Fungal-specific transcription factor domain-domain-containing protein n=1 Tax=Absidia repens TaxID=90262 RepID=A0A1X2IQC4_9FUNG|nr:fungal-specific transcription factor domain-domain-containing protein [Absidia repens]